MKIASVMSGLSAWLLVSACAAPHAEAPAAPAATPASADLPAQPSAAAAPAPAAAAPAPQGLDQAEKEESAPRSRSAPQDDELTSLEAAERALKKAKGDLDRLALAEPGAPIAPGRDGAEKSADKKDSRRASAPSAAGASASETPSATGGGQCENACRAFASLTRAASAVCRLDGDSGTHCGRAKRVVSDSERRVASCACQPPGP